MDPGGILIQLGFVGLLRPSEIGGLREVVVFVAVVTAAKLFIVYVGYAWHDPSIIVELRWLARHPTNACCG